MTEMEMYLMKEVTDMKVKIAKVETLVIEFGKSLESSRNRFHEITDLLMELKNQTGIIEGRTEKGDTNVNFTADNITDVDARSETNINQNINKDGKV